MYEVRLAGGKVFSGLELNGNNFVSRSEVSESDFAELPGRVEIVSDEADAVYPSGEHECMELVQVKKYADGYYFILRDAECGELERLEARVEYLAMKMGVEV